MMDVTTGFYTQDIWTWWLALYLYLGGLGAATLTTTFLTDMYIKPHRELVLWGTWSGIIMLCLGSAMLFLHLLDHVAVIHVLNPMVLINQPNAWIAWGTQFIVWMMVWGFLYALPYMMDSPFFSRIPIVKNILGWRLVQKIGRTCGRHCRLCGWLATINGIGTVVYTGLVLQSFPAVALWHLRWLCGITPEYLYCLPYRPFPPPWHFCYWCWAWLLRSMKKTARCADSTSVQI